MGDVRAKILVDSLDPDPRKAAERVIAEWRRMARGEVDRAIEE